MDDLITRLVVLPNSLLCASVGACVGCWLGGLGVTIDGESHYFFRGAVRGAKAFAIAGWKLPDLILSQATDGRVGQRPILPPAMFIRNPLQLQLDLPHLQQYNAKLQDIRSQHAEELRKWKDICEFHKRKAEEAMLAAASASARAAELQSLFELEETLMEKQLMALARNRSSRTPSLMSRSRSEMNSLEDGRQSAAEPARQPSMADPGAVLSRQADRVNEKTVLVSSSQANVKAGF